MYINPLRFLTIIDLVEDDQPSRKVNRDSILLDDLNVEFTNRVEAVKAMPPLSCLIIDPHNVLR